MALNCRLHSFALAPRPKLKRIYLSPIASDCKEQQTDGENQLKKSTPLFCSRSPCSLVRRQFAPELRRQWDGRQSGGRGGSRAKSLIKPPSWGSGRAAPARRRRPRQCRPRAIKRPTSRRSGRLQYFVRSGSSSARSRRKRRGKWWTVDWRGSNRIGSDWSLGGGLATTLI